MNEAFYLLICWGAAKALTNPESLINLYAGIQGNVIHVQADEGLELCFFKLPELQYCAIDSQVSGTFHHNFYDLHYSARLTDAMGTYNIPDVEFNFIPSLATADMPGKICFYFFCLSRKNLQIKICGRDHRFS